MQEPFPSLNLLPWRENHVKQNKQWFSWVLVVFMILSFAWSGLIFLKKQHVRVKAIEHYQQLQKKLILAKEQERSRQASIKKTHERKQRQESINKQQKVLLSLFEMLQTSMPDKMYLTNIEIKNKTVDIKGVATKTESIEYFVRLFKQPLAFSHVQLTEMDVHPRGVKFAIHMSLST